MALPRKSRLRTPAMGRRAFLGSAVALGAVAASAAQARTPKPNLIVVVVDGIGFGDLGCNGNPYIKTPHLDQLAAESYAFQDFHVGLDPESSRAALLTGSYPERFGMSGGMQSPSVLPADVYTIADLLGEQNGYRNGFFGSWQLGSDTLSDMRSQGSSQDFGHFAAGMKFIEENREQSHFLMLSLNTPWHPGAIPPKAVAALVQAGHPETVARHWAAVQQLDEAIGRLRAHITSLGLGDNTALLFMSASGTTDGALLAAPEGIPPLDGIARAGYNAGMRGKARSRYEGGHRVPCFLSLPPGKGIAPRAVHQLTAHIDMLPTLAKALGVRLPRKVKEDGINLLPFLRDEEKEYPERTIFLQEQGVPNPGFAVLGNRWRLVGAKLYDLRADPQQTSNVAMFQPPLAGRMRQAFLKWQGEMVAASGR